MSDIFEGMYMPYRDEVRAFGSNWHYPTGVPLPHHEAVRVAEYISEADSDGQTAEVWLDAYPARFYHIKALSGTNSVGEPKPPYEVRFGSSQADLCAEIAQKIAEGMIGFYPGEGGGTE